VSEPVRAAGGVIRRGGEVLLVHRPKYGDWTFPKGKAKSGESDEDCALREVEEETGLRCRLGRELASTRYRTVLGVDKAVRYWEMEPGEGSFVPGDEVDEVRWLAPREAASLLSYKRDLPVLASLSPPLLVVRHASAGDSEEWEGDDRLRPLDEKGRRQARALVEKLADYELARILSSPFLRCVQTVEPIAAARGLDVERRDELAEGAGPESARALLEQLAGTPALACVHGEEVSSLFGATKKGATWVVDADLRPTELLPA